MDPRDVRANGRLSRPRQAGHLAALAERLENAERRVDELRGQLHDEIRTAHAAGASLDLIARAAGISPARVHQIVHR